MGIFDDFDNDDDYLSNSDDDEFSGQFESFEDFDEFMKNLRAKSIEEEKKIAPQLFKIRLNSPVDFGLILQTIIYTSRFQS